MNRKHTVISHALLLACLLITSLGAVEATSNSNTATATATATKSASKIQRARRSTLISQHLHESTLATEISTPTNTAVETNINTQTTLVDLQWKNRLIIAFAIEMSDQMDVLREWVASHACELNDRDVLVFALTDKGSRTLNDPTYSLDADSIQRLIQRRQHEDQPFELMLIGKDGGVKANATSPAAMQDLITRIDGMPMRRSEASGQSGNCSNG